MELKRIILKCSPGNSLGSFFGGSLRGSVPGQLGVRAELKSLELKEDWGELRWWSHPFTLSGHESVDIPYQKTGLPCLVNFSVCACSHQARRDTGAEQVSRRCAPARNSGID